MARRFTRAAVGQGYGLTETAAVISLPDEQAGEVPVAVVVPRGGLDPDQLVGWVADRVAPWKRIRAVRLATLSRGPRRARPSTGC